MGKNHTPQNLISLTRESLKTPVRENIANLLVVPRKFKMVLANPPAFEPVDATDDYTKDQLVLLIGSALPELTSFVIEMDDLRGQLVEACSYLRKMHFHAVGDNKGPVKGLVEDVEHLRQRYNQAMDVLRNIAYNVGEEKGKEIARHFVTNSALVNEKPSAEADPTES